MTKLFQWLIFLSLLFINCLSTGTCSKDVEVRHGMEDNELIFFSHIPKCGGRIFSWWVTNVYGIDHVVPGLK